jgi:AAA family ATP:ADP antiporter
MVTVMSEGQTRGGDSVRAWAAGVILLVMMAGHTTLETARDALFLTRLPVQQLPLAYIAIAITALVAAELSGRMRGVAPRRLLALTLFLAALGDLAFIPLLHQRAFIVPHAFYVFIGVTATLATSNFWLLISELFTVLEAKRVYSLISAGGVFGAVIGGGLARVGNDRLGEPGLIALGAGLLLAAGIITALTTKLKVDGPVASQPTPLTAANEQEPLRDLKSIRYLRRLLALGLVSTIAATLVDYLFKAQIAQSVPPAGLAQFFATFNMTVNSVALLAQFVIAPSILSSAGVGRSLLLVPIVLGLGGLAVTVAPGLLSVLVLRGSDGSLRYSIHRSSLEVLFLPLSSRARARWKVLVDLIGQRGGQALASLLIFGCIAAALSVRQMAVLVVGLTVVWLVLASGMEKGYVALFRAKVRAGSIETRAEVPELDLRSLELLVAALGSEIDDEVLASIALLVDHDRAHVIPSVLLYHPSRAVVLRTLEVFANAGRNDYSAAARRLLDRDDDEVRAAAMLALAGQMTAAELGRELSAQLPMAARAAVLVAIVSRGLDADGSCAREIVEGCAPAAGTLKRLSFARAFRLQGGASSVTYLPRLLPDAPPELELETARAMLATVDPSYVPFLLQMLDSRAARSVARDVLVAIGPIALGAVATALDDTSLPRSLRAHLPRSLSRFGSAEATDLLLDRLERERDGWVRFKIIRGLGQLRDHLDTPERQRRCSAVARSSLVQALRFLATRLENERDLRSHPQLATEGGELLISALRDKQAHAIDRAVRLIGLRHSANIIHSIRQGLAGRDPRLRGDASELLVHGAPRDLAVALSALLDTGPEDTRSSRAADALHVRLPTRSYEQRLADMLTGPSEAVRSIAAFHIHELSEQPQVGGPAMQEASRRANDVLTLANELLEGTRLLATRTRPS